MPAQLVHFAYPILILVIGFFFAYRFKRETENRHGIGYIYAGLTVVFIFTLLNLMEYLPGYDDWFLEGVYPLLVVLNFVVLAIGLVLFIYGLASVFAGWQEKVEESEVHLSKLRLLEQIEYECRRPLQTVELLDRVLSLLLEGLSERSGAVYLYEPDRKGFDMVSSKGFTDRELTLLKHYPLGTNIISNSIENRRPMVTGDFRSFGGKAQIALNRFGAMAVFPLVSGKSRLGALIFFARERSRYDEQFTELVKPITGWLSERLEVLRLGRDFRRTVARQEKREAELDHYLRKLSRITEAVRDTVGVSEYAMIVKELIDVDAVYLIGIKEDEIHPYGGTTDRMEFSEEFTRAVIRAMRRGRAVVLNQEEEEEGGQKKIIGSNLMLPIGIRDDTLLLQRKGDPINLTEREMKSLAIAATLAGMVIAHQEEKGLSAARIKAFSSIDDILRLRLTKDDTCEEFIRKFTERVSENLGYSTILLVCRRSGDTLQGYYCNVDLIDMSSIEIELGESIAGRSAAMKREEFAFGYTAVSQYLGRFQGYNKVNFRNLFGDNGIPAFFGCYPILMSNRTEYLLMAFEFDPESLSGKERHQFYSVITALINIRMEFLAIRQNESKTVEKPVETDDAPVQEPLHIKTKKILVVADQKVIAELVSSMCESLGHEVVTASNPSQGLAQFKSSVISAVLTDMSTPNGPEEVATTDLAGQGVSVWDMFKEMRASSEDIPIIAMIGAGRQVDREEYRSAGVHGILYKPFQISQLARILNRAGIS